MRNSHMLNTPARLDPKDKVRFGETPKPSRCGDQDTGEK
jgi:hypothetical protein